MDKKKWTIDVEEALELANDIGLIGEVTDEWKINEAHALTKVYDQDEQYESTLSKQLGRLKVVINKLKSVIDTEQTSPLRILYTLEWLKTKTDNIRQTRDVQLNEYRRFARHQAFD